MDALRLNATGSALIIGAMRTALTPASIVFRDAGGGVVASAALPNLTVDITEHEIEHAATATNVLLAQQTIATAALQVAGVDIAAMTVGVGAGYNISVPSMNVPAGASIQIASFRLPYTGALEGDPMEPAPVLPANSTFNITDDGLYALNLPLATSAAGAALPNAMYWIEGDEKGQLRYPDGSNYSGEMLTSAQLAAGINYFIATLPNAPDADSIIQFAINGGQITKRRVLLNISALAGNNPPTLGNITHTLNDTIADDMLTVSDQLSAVDPDPDAVLTYGIPAGQTGTGGLVFKTGEFGVLSLDPLTGAYTYTADRAKTNALAGGADGVDLFTVSATDGAAVVTATITVTIHGADDRPVIVEQGIDINVPVNGSSTFLGTEGVVDPEGVALTVTAVSVPSLGSASFLGNDVTYDAPAAPGNTTFTVTLSDGTNTVEQTVNVTIEEVSFPQRNWTVAYNTADQGDPLAVDTPGDVTVTHDLPAPYVLEYEEVSGGAAVANQAIYEFTAGSLSPSTETGTVNWIDATMASSASVSWVDDTDTAVPDQVTKAGATGFKPTATGPKVTIGPTVGNEMYDEWDVADQIWVEVEATIPAGAISATKPLMVLAGYNGTSGNVGIALQINTSGELFASRYLGDGTTGTHSSGTYAVDVRGTGRRRWRGGWRANTPGDTSVGALGKVVLQEYVAGAWVDRAVGTTDRNRPVYTGMGSTPTMRARVLASAGDAAQPWTGTTIWNAGVMVGESAGGGTVDTVIPANTPTVITETEYNSLKITTTGVNTFSTPGTIEARWVGGTGGEDVAVIVGTAPVGGTGEGDNPLETGTTVAAVAGEPAYVEIYDWTNPAAPVSVGVLDLTERVHLDDRLVSPTLHALMGTWDEFTSRAALPVIGTFEFHGVRFKSEKEQATPRYEIALFTRPTAAHWPEFPEGLAAGKNTIVPPFKAEIQDVNGAVLGTMEWPGGLPVNANYVTNDPGSGERWKVWRGPRDGNSIPQYEVAAAGHVSGQKYYRPLTIHQAAIWESRPASLHSQASLDTLRPKWIAPSQNQLRSSSSTNPSQYTLIYSQTNGMNNIFYMEEEPLTAAEQTAHGNNDLYTGSLTYGRRATLEGWKYIPGNNGGRTHNTGEGGMRWDRAVWNEALTQVIRNRTAIHAYSGQSWMDVAWNTQKNHASDPIHVTRPASRRFLPLDIDNFTTSRRHRTGYYLTATTAPDAIDLGFDRPWNMLTGTLSLLIPDTAYASAAQDSAARKYPIFNNFSNDYHHDQFFAGHGAVYWRSPLMQRMQQFNLKNSRMLQLNKLIYNGTSDPTMMWDRPPAWAMAQMAMSYMIAAEKTGFSREAILEEVASDIAAWWGAFGPGLTALPANFNYASAKDMFIVGSHKFGVVTSATASDDTSLHMFFLGYWMQAFTLMKQSGLWDAIRAHPVHGAACTAWTNWAIASVRKTMIGFWTHAELLRPTRSGSGPTYTYSSYNYIPAAAATWAAAAGVSANMPDWSGLPTTEAARYTKPSWDRYPADHTSGSSLQQGMGMDFFIAIPSWLKYGFGEAGADLDTLITKVAGYRQEKLNHVIATHPSNGGYWFINELSSFTPFNAANAIPVVG